MLPSERLAKLKIEQRDTMLYECFRRKQYEGAPVKKYSSLEQYGAKHFPVKYLG